MAHFWLGTFAMLGLCLLQLAVAVGAAIEGVSVPVGSCVCVSEGMVDAYASPGYGSEDITYLGYNQCLRSHGHSLEMNGETWFPVGVKSEETAMPRTLWVSGKFLKKGSPTQCT